MAHIEWTSTAFARLESLPQKQAFQIMERIFLLECFPLMGPRLSYTHPELQGCRLLYIDRTYRVIYEWNESLDRVWIMVIRHGREQPPTIEELSNLLP